jgi:hypothetical protein
MASAEPLYAIREHPRFLKDLEQLTTVFKVDAPTLDDIISGIKWALSHNPQVFPLAHDHAGLRVVKTNRVDRGLASVPMLRIWFRICDGNAVELLKVETLDLFL